MLTGPEATSGRRTHQHVQRFVTPAPRARVWAWLVDPATFTDTQIPPWRVEFLGGGFDEGVVTTHHGPGLHLPGVICRDPRGRVPRPAVPLRRLGRLVPLLRPTRLQIAVADAPGGTEVEVRIDAHVHPRMLRLWALSQRLFWRRFATWTAKATAAA